MFISRRPTSNPDPQTSIAAAFPLFREEQIAQLGEGWDFQVFEVGADWLFRFPKRSESVVKLEVECRLLAKLAPRLVLPIPNYQHISGLFEQPGPPFAGYRKLPGIPGDQVEHVDRPTVARQLGTFLRQLRCFPVAQAQAAGVTERTEQVARWRARALTQLPTILDLPLEAGQLYRYVEQKLPQPLQGDPVLIHNDLWAEHILIDPASGRVSGIIDWGDVAIGDPATDLAFLHTWFGEHWLKGVISHYGDYADSIDMTRIRYLSTCLAIHNITLGQELGRAAWIKAGKKALEWIHVN